MDGTTAVAPQGVLFRAPHRAMFLAGMLAVLLSFALWAWVLIARLGWWAMPQWVLPVSWVHALLSLGAAFPFFIFGFLLTAMPRWQAVESPPRKAWLPGWRLLVAGWALMLPGLWLPGLALLALLVVLAGWCVLAAALWQVAFRSPAAPLHARAAWFGVGGGVVALLAWLVVLGGGGAGWARVAIEAGLWWFLLPVFVSVCHRMIPFFSSSIIPGYALWRPAWALHLLLAAAVVHGALAMAALGQWSWLVDAPAALVALMLSVRWRPLAAQRVRLLGMLHFGFAWLGVAWLLYAVQSALALAGIHVFAHAPLHALAVGFFASILLAMVSRVTLGHSGRPLLADGPTWALFLVLQAVAVLRVGADLLPFLPWAPAMAVAVAVGGWLAVFGVWALRYLPIYLRPRSDGGEG
ncbi:NnrS family protein [Pseudothauera lacus]|uniref:NnrS family protein n=1 Tax=Pseudothauera lacus TaxID=2136175 RepID=A0A2T4IHK1_9RHOO|nr:NnrS family protein [Pseudothauera lacus]PTD97237.1 NnrS family protein [Pseudothauera lacus]